MADVSGGRDLLLKHLVISARPRHGSHRKSWHTHVRSERPRIVHTTRLPTGPFGSGLLDYSIGH